MNAAEFEAQEKAQIAAAKKQVADAPTEEAPSTRGGVMGTLESIAQSRLDPVSMLRSVDPLSPELPLKNRLWNAAMAVGPAGAQGLAAKAIPALAEHGLPNAIGRIIAGGLGGAAVGAPFGKTMEGAAAGLAGGAVGEPLHYLGRGAKFGAAESLRGSGGPTGVMKKFVNTLGELTGLGKDLAKDGRQAISNIGEWKSKYYNDVYDPLKTQAKEDFPPDGAPSPFIKQMYQAGHGEAVLPSRIADQLKASAEAETEMRGLAEEGSFNQKKFQLAMQNAKTPQERQTLTKQFEDSQVETEAKRQVLADLPRYRDRLKDPMITFDEYDETIRNLRNYGWNGVKGEPRQGPLSADERAAVHGLKQEMLGHFPDQALADAYTQARDYAHAWETTSRMIKNSKYGEGVRPRMSEMQRQFQGHVEDIKDALGPKYAELLNQVLFNGRLTPDRLSREWGEGSASFHSGGFGASLIAHAKPPLLQGAPMTTPEMAAWTAPTSVALGQLVKPSEEEPLSDKLLRAKQLVLPSE